MYYGYKCVPVIVQQCRNPPKKLSPHDLHHKYIYIFFIKFKINSVLTIRLCDLNC